MLHTCPIEPDDWSNGPDEAPACLACDGSGEEWPEDVPSTEMVKCSRCEGILFFAVEAAMDEKVTEPTVQLVIREVKRLAPELPPAVRFKLWLQIDRKCRRRYHRPYNEAWGGVIAALKQKETSRA